MINTQNQTSVVGIWYCGSGRGVMEKTSCVL